MSRRRELELLSEEKISLSKTRQGCDYDDFYIISKEEVEEQLENSKKFILEVEKFLKTKY